MARKTLTLLLSLALLTVNPGSGWAVQHVKPGAYPHPFQDMIHHPSAEQIRAAGSIRAATISSASGTKHVAVIIVQFHAGNASLISGSNSIQSLANIDTYFTQMASYYNEISYGKITLQFKFFGGGLAQNTAAFAGEITLGNPEEYYGCGDEGQGNIPPCSSVTTPAIGANGDYLIRDALTAARAADPTLTTANYDEVMVVHAGNGNETTTGKNGDIWSIFYSQDAVIQAAGGGFDEGDVVPETETSGISSPLGVMCHEFGHSLGLPDLYNTSAIGGSSVVGKWEIMDSGPYGGPVGQGGTNPSHMCAWDKMTLGWVTPTVITTKTSASLNYIENNQSLLKIPVQNGLAQEYFLVEYRSPSSGATYDKFIPGTGLLIWHVDDAITSSRGINATAPGTQNTVNTGSPHYGVSIISADGISVGSTGGTANNPFGNGHNFTSPASDNFSAQPSGISIVNIGGVGSGTASLQVVNLQSTAGQSISSLVNYPNPAGKGYAHPNGAGHTTIQMQLTRPATDFGFNIYTLAGALVRRVGASDITLNTDRSADDKWVYEYVWDLTNGDGKMVAPGVYLYLGRADGQTKSGKAVIIR